MKKFFVILAALIFAVISCGDKQELNTTEKGGEGMDVLTPFFWTRFNNIS